MPNLYPSVEAFEVDFALVYNIDVDLAPSQEFEIDLGGPDVIEIDFQSLIQEINITNTFVNVEEATKSSAIDAGEANDLARDDDYFYVCTTTGTAGNAIWKKAVLLRT